MDNFVDDGDANNDVVDIWNRALTKIMFHDTGFAWWLKQLVESEFGVTLKISEDDANDIVKTRELVIVIMVAMVVVMTTMMKKRKKKMMMMMMMMMMAVMIAMI